MRGRYLRSPTTGRSFARARHADLRPPPRSARDLPRAGSRRSTRAHARALSWIDRERISGWRRMRPRASGASSEAGVSWGSWWCVIGDPTLGAPADCASSRRGDVGFGDEPFERVRSSDRRTGASERVTSNRKWGSPLWICQAYSVQGLFELPALVRPRPVGRRGADLLLDQARVSRREFAARRAVRPRRRAARIPLRSGRARCASGAGKTPAYRVVRAISSGPRKNAVSRFRNRIQCLRSLDHRLLVGDHRDGARRAALLDDVA